MSNQRQTVEAGRRRKPGQAPPGGRERADAPQHRPSGGASGGGSGGSSGGGSGGGLPSLGGGLSSLGGGGGKPLSLGALALVVVCVICLAIYGGLNGGGLLGGQEQTVDNPVDTTGQEPAPQAQAPFPTSPPAAPAQRPAVNPSGQKWLVMLYQDADDKILEQDIYLDLNEAERVGSTERVQIVAQVDRYQGAYQGDGDWTSTKRYIISQDSDLNRVRSREAEDLGEVNMADGNTLVDFVTWAVQNFPADKYVLILSDHGMGWPGGWSDSDPQAGGVRNIPLASRLGDNLFLMELDQALETIRSQAGIDQFELVGMDACLMGQIEVLSALQPHSHYAVVSQEVEPALGWAYTGFLEELVQNPDMDGAELSRLIVDNYIGNDQRVVDDQARAEFLRQGSPMGGLFGFSQISPAELARQLGENATLTAVDLSALPALMDRFNALLYGLQSVDQSQVARARSRSQTFTNIFGDQVPPSFIDLGHFVALLQQAGLADASEVQAAVQRLIVAEKHGPKVPGATGLAIYFPNSQLYGLDTTGPRSYTAIADRFARLSLWDDFLSYHYSGRPFEATGGMAAIPPTETPISAPGQGKIEISPVQVSNASVTPGNTVTLSADIVGQNLGHIYLFVGYLDQASNSIYMADSDYLESSDTRDLNGVYYPVWPESGDFTLKFDWEPVVFAISDGQQNVPALFTPQSYGVDFEQAVYTVDGIYTFAEGGEQRYARLLFSNGQLRQVYGFNGGLQEGQGPTGSPREITPQPGDTFTVLNKWMALDANGQMTGTTLEPGETLTFGDQMFTWETLDAAAGNYVVGFIVEDLDGNLYPAFTQVEVR